jgi:hypothetical protein
VATFDQAHASSDGGAVLLKAADRALGLIARMAEALTDHRTAGRVTHSLRDLVAQRIFGIGCRYADANDADGLADASSSDSGSTSGVSARKISNTAADTAR